MPKRPMEGATTGEAARPSEETDLTTPLVNLRLSAREVAKTLAEASVAEDWQVMITAGLASHLKDDEGE